MDRAMVARATSRDPAPTPGYMYDEIARMTHANFEGCKALEGYLLDRIRVSNAYSKFKCLMIIKHVCLKGRPEFRKDMQRSVDAIKDCLTFTAPPDPLRGDEPNRRVREAAKETLEALYADSHGPSAIGGVYAAGTSSQYGNRIEGIGGGEAAGGPQPYGSGNGASFYVRSAVERFSRTGSDLSGYSGSMGGAGMQSGNSGGGGSLGGSYRPGGSGNGSSMQGIGNYDPAEHKTWLERASETVKATAVKAVEAVDSVRQARQQRGADALYSGSPDYPPGGFTSNRGAAAYSSGSYDGASVTSGYRPAADGPAGGMQHGSGSGGAWGASGAASGAHMAPPAAAYQAQQQVPLGGARPAAAAAEGYEARAVAKVCMPTGTRSVPTKAETEEFVSLALGLEEDRLGEALLEVAFTGGGAGDGGDTWRAQSKALTLIAVLVQRSETYRAYFTDAAERGELDPCCASQRAAVRDRAVALLSRLGLTPPTAAAPQRHAETASGDDAQAAAAPPDAAAPLPGGDLLGDYEVDLLIDAGSAQRSAADARDRPRDWAGAGGEQQQSTQHPAIAGSSASSNGTSSNNGTSSSNGGGRARADLLGGNGGGDADSSGASSAGGDNGGLFGDMLVVSATAQQPASPVRAAEAAAAAAAPRSDESPVQSQHKGTAIGSPLVSLQERSSEGPPAGSASSSGFSFIASGDVEANNASGNVSDMLSGLVIAPSPPPPPGHQVSILDFS
ncbi:hypothetical protein JKP88DRAFT_264021 [Tribonema minus]|uniref:ENTH domain-containing protein n=1 Tax=Tribonema minus TaxID=303371 RepID=A0A835YV47_9STRA|nr:hypothetical protein JKP88DRAFT_264021 [Tribonema minus]